MSKHSLCAAYVYLVLLCFAGKERIQLFFMSLRRQIKSKYIKTGEGCKQEKEFIIKVFFSGCKFMIHVYGVDEKESFYAFRLNEIASEI